LWNGIWELKTLDGRALVVLRPRGVLQRHWEVEEGRTGTRVSARIPNPLILGKQSAELVGGDGAMLAQLQWEEYAWGLGCHRRVRVEVKEPFWELAALTLAVVRWVTVQQR
jgi:hypothetical protein